MPPISSREYKVMLHLEPFGGSQEQVSESILRFWDTFASAIKSDEAEVRGRLDDWKEDRRIRFYDTADAQLMNSRFILRERSAFETGDERQLTLKFRSLDRLVSGDAQVKAADGFKNDAKFEEDLKLPSASLFSRSNTIEIPRDARVERLSDAAAFFPGLVTGLPNFRPEASLSMVNNREHREFVVKGAKILLVKNPEVKARCAMILWYAVGDETPGSPEAVEFSYNFDVSAEGSPEDRETAARAGGIFKTLGALSKWVDPEGITKTGLAYGG